jgi:hypothetical protein
VKIKEKRGQTLTGYLGKRQHAMRQVPSHPLPMPSGLGGGLGGRVPRQLMNIFVGEANANHMCCGGGVSVEVRLGRCMI